jgi:hypothetical protein
MKRFTRFTTLVFVLAIALSVGYSGTAWALSGTTANATDVKNLIDGWHGLTATDSGDEVTVSGTANDVTDYLEIDNSNPNVVIKWEATLVGISPGNPDSANFENFSENLISLKGRGTFRVFGTISNDQGDTIESTWNVVVESTGTVSNTGEDPMENIAIQAFDYYNGSDLVFIDSGGTVYAPYAKAIQLENVYCLLDTASDMSGVTGLVDDDGETYNVYGNVVLKNHLFNRLEDDGSIDGDEEVTFTIKDGAVLTLNASDDSILPPSPGDNPAVTVVVESGGEFIIASGASLTNNGKIRVSGKLTNNGKIWVSGTLENNGTIVNNVPGGIVIHEGGTFSGSDATPYPVVAEVPTTPLIPTDPVLGNLVDSDGKIKPEILQEAGIDTSKAVSMNVFSAEATIADSVVRAIVGTKLENLAGLNPEDIRFVKIAPSTNPQGYSVVEFERAKNQNELLEEGMFLIADGNGNPLADGDTIKAGTDYKIYISIKDNGDYDWDKDDFEIVDPGTLATKTTTAPPSGGGGGCSTGSIGMVALILGGFLASKKRHS